MITSLDYKTAEAFSNSWMNCFSASPYSFKQAEEWFQPVKLQDLCNDTVCELGCGNGGLLQHIVPYTKKRVVGVDLGQSVETAISNFNEMRIWNVRFYRSDIIQFADDHPNEFDFVYCIGVLHHMKDPYEGFKAVVKTTIPGGRFHCWVYGYEGNFVIRIFIDYIRKIVSHLHWRIIKYGIAFPLSLPFFFLSQIIRNFTSALAEKMLPLYSYLRWISEYSFKFHHHVAFDQLVAPRTTYIKKPTIEKWLSDLPVKNEYILSRNGNSWKFGGIKV